VQAETRFKERFLHKLKQIPKLWYVKVQMVATKGIPDVLICHKGLFIAVELKVGNNKATKLQQFTLDKIKEAGGNIWIVNEQNEKEFLTFLEAL